MIVVLYLHITMIVVLYLHITMIVVLYVHITMIEENSVRHTLSPFDLYYTKCTYVLLHRQYFR